jgi:UDP-N-acetylmuramoyl-tripeptide--D-alanyl-D-alanine ligase
MTNKRLKELHEIYLNHPNIVRDNRQIQEGDIFWALKGEKFNGNDFAQNAIDKGAHIAVIDNIKLKNKKFFLVDDSLRALQELGRFHREYVGMPVIGITGSNGKTTTKELVNAVLSQLYNTSFTYKNLNNHIGVPLTLLDIPEDTDLAIVEMGSNHFGEIKTLVDLALPNFAVITSIGKAHL